jgi:hypothetical protein
MPGEFSCVAHETAMTSETFPSEIDHDRAQKSHWHLIGLGRVLQQPPGGERAVYANSRKD